MEPVLGIALILSACFNAWFAYKYHTVTTHIKKIYEAVDAGVDHELTQLAKMSHIHSDLKKALTVLSFIEPEEDSDEKTYTGPQLHTGKNPKRR